jgi:hypothetical protein
MPESSKSGSKRNVQSAPSKMGFSKQAGGKSMMLGDEGMEGKMSGLNVGEIIPAATYEPDDDVDAEISDNGSDEVSKTFDKDLSKFGGGNWLARCEMREENRTPNLSFLKKHTSTIKIAELGEGNDEDEKDGKGGEGEESELTMRNLVNPCSKIREERVERRVSERLQEANKVKNIDTLKEQSKKRTLEGMIDDHNSFLS